MSRMAMVVMIRRVSLSQIGDIYGVCTTKGYVPHISDTYLVFHTIVIVTIMLRIQRLLVPQSSVTSRLLRRTTYTCHGSAAPIEFLYKRVQAPQTCYTYMLLFDAGDDDDDDGTKGVGVTYL